MFDLNVKRQHLGYKLHINGLEMGEILTYVSMYGGSSVSFFRYERSNKAVPFSAFPRACKLILAIRLYGGPTFP